MIDTIEGYKQKTGLTVTKLLNFAKLPSSKYYEWKKRYGEANRHNGKIPRNHQILEVEREAIIEYANSNKGVEGYRRMCYRMLDEDVAAVSPSTVYRVLKGAGLLSKVKGKPSSKGDGYSRYIINHDLRASMETYDVEIVLQEALEKYPEAKPRLISDYIEYYNKERLHSAINYLTPEDMLMGRAEERLSERMKKLKLARERRKEFHENKKSSLFQYA